MSTVQKPTGEKLLKLNEFIMDKHPTYPQKFYQNFEDKDDINLTWYKQIGENDWKKCGEGFIYTPSTEDVGHTLKLVYNNNGQTYEAISENVVDSGPSGNNPCLNRFILGRNVNKKKEFRVLTYNILADCFTSSEHFPYCPSYALKIDYRKQLILKELLEYNPDIICLQEVDVPVFEEDLKPVLNHWKYEGMYVKQGGPSARDGQACFYHSAKFRWVDNYAIIMADAVQNDELYDHIWKVIHVNELLKQNVIERLHALQVLILDSIETPKERIVLGNTHLLSNPAFPHIKALQALICMTFLQKVQDEQKKFCPEKNVSLIFCGDFNTMPISSVYKFMTTGYVSGDHFDFTEDEQKIQVGKILFQHQFKLKSACGTPKFSNYTGDFVGLLDYIFYESKFLSVVRTVPIISEEDVTEYTAIPSIYFPSDHIPLIADFKFHNSCFSRFMKCCKSSGNK